MPLETPVRGSCAADAGRSRNSTGIQTRDGSIVNHTFKPARLAVVVLLVMAALELLRRHGTSPGMLWTLAAAGAIFVLVEGFSFYNRTYPQPAQPDNYELHTVQFDDLGSLWDPAQAEKVLERVDTSWQAGNTFVYVFIHGWNHNASPSDPNLLDFNAKTLAKLCLDLSSDERKALRAKLTGSEHFRLIGLYVGWRGRSLPGFLNYATMWWRKSAAERVGEGDASEFIERLQRMYLRANAVTRSPEDSAVKPMMGLVTIGHSFGGQLLLKSVSRSMEFALAERATKVADVTQPAANAPATAVRLPVDSLGDLNILLNPATEAYQFGRIDSLYRQLEFPDTQTPQLVIFSADNDVPREAFFPIARLLTLPFRPSFRDPYQGRLFGKSLGVLQAQLTHGMQLAPDQSDSLANSDYTDQDGDKVRTFDFSDVVRFGGVEMRRLPAVGALAPPIANSPVSVVLVHDKIIDGHNGIFIDQFQRFLAAYVAFVEGKRLMIRHERFTAAAAAKKAGCPGADGAGPPPSAP